MLFQHKIVLILLSSKIINELFQKGNSFKESFVRFFWISFDKKFFYLHTKVNKYGGYLKEYENANQDCMWFTCEI